MRPFDFNSNSGGNFPVRTMTNTQRMFRPPKPAPEHEFVSVFRILETAFLGIKETIGELPAETGGLLLGDPYTGIITDFLFDQDARTSGSIYYPTIEFLNREIPRFEAKGKHPLGIVHSHPDRCTTPSGPDLSAAYNNITSPHNGHLRTWHMPIVQSVATSGQFEFHPYIVSCGGLGKTVLHTPRLEIVDVAGRVITRDKVKSKKFTDTHPSPPQARKQRIATDKKTALNPWGKQSLSLETLARLNKEYERIAGQVNFAKMLDTSIIHVGVGASSTSIEQFSRIGIKRWILFDLDTVEKKNLVAQDFEITDIGKLKVHAMRERMERCEFERASPDVPPLSVDTYEDFLAPDDMALDALIEAEKKVYSNVILVAATDFHPAQARAARLGIRHEIPTFFIGAYRDGLAGEMIFYHPKAKDMPCYRCITESRYVAFDNRPVNTQVAAKSSGLPFSIGVLDSQLAHLIVGCIHYEYAEKLPGYGFSKDAVHRAYYHDNGFLSEEVAVKKNPHSDLFRELIIENRNFLQTQLNPSYRMAGEDIFRDGSGVHGANVKTFITMFQQDSKKSYCLDCSNPKAWRHSDYRLDAKL